MSRIEHCPICSRVPRDVSRLSSRDAYEIICDRCGTYSITGSLLVALEGPTNPDVQVLRPYLSAFTRQTGLAGASAVLTSDNWREAAESHSTTPVLQKLRMALDYLGRASSLKGGQRIHVGTDVDFPLFDAADAEEADWLVWTLRRQGLIDQNSTDASVTLTASGWDAYRPWAVGGIEGTCFVAMAFDPGLDACLERGIEPAVKECGFNVLRLDRVEHNENINDKIIADIRSCQFMVADFTLHRNGVYFEAGFALGLGKPVIWLCRKDGFGTAHFDTRPYNHILWESPEELRERLRDRIRATIPNAKKDIGQ